MGNSMGDEMTVYPGGGREPELKAGERMGQYEIIRLLGRGGMGQVYLARHSMMHTRHAVKLLPAEHAVRPGFVDRFRAEVQVMANLKHPGIVNVTHADVTPDGRYYLVMEFVGDEAGSSLDLEQVLANAPGNRLDPAVAASLALQIAEAVAYAHSHGVIHRDLKPSNVLVSGTTKNTNGHENPSAQRLVPNASVKITDFGLAKMVGEEWVQSVIQASLSHQSIGDQPTIAGGLDPGSSTKSILGTYEYMSPEQREGREADERSDIYAFGVMLYRMLTGRRIMGFPKPPSRIVEGLDSKWDDLIVDCLEADPADRPQSMEEVREKLLTTKDTKNTKTENGLAAKEHKEHESSTTGNVVPKAWQEKVAENGGNCGDGLAWALEKYLSGKTLVPALEELGNLNGVDVRERWSHVDNGMQRMNLGNVLRGMIRRGEKVEVPDVCIWNPEKGVKLRYTKKRLHFIRPLIEDLDADEVFEIICEAGTFRMSRAQFEEMFDNIPETISWKRDGEYHCDKPPQKAMRFLVDRGSGSVQQTEDIESDASSQKKSNSGKWLIVLVVLGLVASGILFFRDQGSDPHLTFDENISSGLPDPDHETHEAISGLNAGSALSIQKAESTPAIPKGARGDILDCNGTVVARSRIAASGKDSRSVRNYPKGVLMAHVLGVVDQDGVGSSGIEQAMEDFLSNNSSIYLTIDQQIQYVTENAVEKMCRDFHAKAGWAIVQHVRTGEILAMASYPTYDLNRFGETPPEWMRNRAIGFNFEPGSTMKAAVIACALDHGIVKTNDLIDCENGSWIYGGKVLRDSHEMGVVPASDVIKHSSNIGTAKIALLMGDQLLYDSLKSFCFGTRLGVGIPGEEGGIFHAPRNWSKISATRVGMGHEIAATALQIVSMMSAIAYNGVQMQPMLIKRVVAPDGTVLEEYQPQELGRPLSPPTARIMQRLLANVVEEDGTGTKARVEGYTVGGKTGTAQKINPAGGYFQKNFTSSFVGFLPVDNPEICIIVVADDPGENTESGRKIKYDGGTVCEPTFREIADFAVQYFHIQSTQTSIMSGTEDLKSKAREE